MANHLHGRSTFSWGGLGFHRTKSFIIHLRPALKCRVIAMDKEPAQAVKLHFFAFHLGMKE